MYIKQINNMKIKYDKALYHVFFIETPDKIRLEEFDTLEKAEEYARNTKDFILRK